MDFKNIDNNLEALRPEMIEMQKKLTAFAAVGPDSGGPGEAEKADWLKQWLDDNGFPEVREYNAPDDRVPAGYRPNLFTVIPGKDTSKTVWILAHTDVVPEGDLSKWQTDPYEVVEKDGKLYGRGTEDNQQGLVSGVFAAKALLDSGETPDFNVGIALVADEETGSIYGLDYVVEKYPDIFGKDDIVIVPDAGSADSTFIEVAEKSILWLKIQTFGKQCHASTPDAGINAFVAASNLVVRLNKLHDLFPHNDPVFDPPISTFQPTKKEANVPNVNTIPGDDVFYLDCRVMPEYDLADIKKAVREMADGIEAEFGVKIDIGTTQDNQAAPSTPDDAEVVKILQKGIKDVYNADGKPIGIGGGTFAAFLRHRGINVAVWSTLDDMCHQPNEYCVIDYMVNDAKVMFRSFFN
jgi:succinyl-diaminopimelate desuccinylase